MLNKNLRVRFVVYFFITMLLSTVIAGLLTGTVVASRLDKQLSRNQEQVVSTLSELLSSDDTRPTETVSVASYEVYSIHRIDRSNPIIAKYLDRLDSGEAVMEEHWLLPTVTTFFSAGGNYYEISLMPTGGFMMTTASSLIVATLSTVVLGTVLAVFAGKRFLKPIRALSRATEQVSQGNFDVRVDVPKNAELGKLCSNFNSMAHDLSRIETLQREFTSNVSHEFKTPLASISGFAKILQQPGLTEEDRMEYTSIIAEESDRLSRMAVNILRLTKLQNIDDLPDKAPLQLDEQLRRCIALLEPQWSRKEIEMDIELDEISVFSNAELLQEIWMNLLSNAIKFTPNGGQIAVSLHDTPDGAAVEVRDSGCGMTDDVKKRIFDKFYQGDRSHSSEGNGLGLALVKRIVELCHAEITVKSEPDKGSLFRVVLPHSST